jgi:hypothetical protein
VIQELRDRKGGREGKGRMMDGMESKVKEARDGKRVTGSEGREARDGKGGKEARGEEKMDGINKEKARDRK